MNSPRRCRKRQSGLSLIELMVAMGLSLFLLLGLVNVFIANKAAVQMETSLAHLQENGRTALDLMAADIRNALFMGCASASATPVVMSANTAYTGLLGFERTTSAWSPPLPSGLSAIAARNRPGSDVFNIQYSLDMNLTAAARVTGLSSAVSVASNPSRLTTGDRVVLANCSGSHVFTIANQPSVSGGATTFAWGPDRNDIASVNSNYAVGDDVFEFAERTWYVTNTGRTRLEGTVPVYALMRRSNGRAEEMVQGVEYLQVIYGERLDNGNMRHVPASDASLDMSRVVSVRLGLLMQSFEPVLNENDAATYQVLDQSIGSADTTFTHNGDRTLRRVFASTVVLRNRSHRL